MDLNLLRVLDTLLQESSVTAAAERLGGTSPPAVSRSLSRLRRITGDQLLVRAGQALVPTPRALAIRDTLHTLLGQADQLLRPGGEFDPPTTISETFTVQVSDLFLTSVADPLLETLQREAPGVNVIFLPETLEGTTALRRGDVDVELGVLSHLDPETRHQTLAETTLLGVARATNAVRRPPHWRRAVRRRRSYRHLSLGKRRGPIDDALTRLGLHRRVAVVVPSHTSAMLLARSTDLVALTAPVWSDTIVAELGLATFPIPLDLLPMTIGVAWHPPRNDIDPAHRWFRTQLSRAFIQAQQTSPPEEEQREPAHAQGVGVATRNG